MNKLDPLKPSRYEWKSYSLSLVTTIMYLCISITNTEREKVQNKCIFCHKLTLTLHWNTVQKKLQSQGTSHTFLEQVNNLTREYVVKHYWISQIWFSHEKSLMFSKLAYTFKLLNTVCVSVHCLNFKLRGMYFSFGNCNGNCDARHNGIFK